MDQRNALNVSLLPSQKCDVIFNRIQYTCPTKWDKSVIYEGTCLLNTDTLDLADNEDPASLKGILTRLIINAAIELSNRGKSIEHLINYDKGYIRCVVTSELMSLIEISISQTAKVYAADDTAISLDDFSHIRQPLKNTDFDATPYINEMPFRHGDSKSSMAAFFMNAVAPLRFVLPLSGLGDPTCDYKKDNHVFSQYNANGYVLDKTMFALQSIATMAKVTNIQKHKIKVKNYSRIEIMERTIPLYGDPDNPPTNTSSKDHYLLRIDFEREKLRLRKKFMEELIGVQSDMKMKGHSTNWMGYDHETNTRYDKISYVPSNKKKQISQYNFVKQTFSVTPIDFTNSLHLGASYLGAKDTYSPGFSWVQHDEPRAYTEISVDPSIVHYVAHVVTSKIRSALNTHYDTYHRDSYSLHCGNGGSNANDRSSTDNDNNHDHYRYRSFISNNFSSSIEIRLPDQHILTCHMVKRETAERFKTRVKNYYADQQQQERVEERRSSSAPQSDDENNEQKNIIANTNTTTNNKQPYMAYEKMIKHWSSSPKKSEMVIDKSMLALTIVMELEASD